MDILLLCFIFDGCLKCVVGEVLTKRLVGKISGWSDYPNSEEILPKLNPRSEAKEYLV
jgi:hypothetical protein